MDKIAFRTVLIHEFWLVLKVTETVENVNKAKGDGTAADLIVQKWFQKFRNGNESLLKQIVQKDPRQSVSDIAAKMHVSLSMAFENKLYANNLGDC